MGCSVVSVGGEALVTLEGVVDLAMAPLVRYELVELFNERHHRIVVDLTEVLGIDEAAVALLAGAASHARRRNVELVLLLPGPLPVVVSDPVQVRSLFD
jgi:anti-anti-sigma factor